MAFAFDDGKFVLVLLWRETKLLLLFLDMQSPFIATKFHTLMLSSRLSFGALMHDDDGEMKLIEININLSSQS